jgi:hypothetical protein
MGDRIDDGDRIYENDIIERMQRTHVGDALYRQQQEEAAAEAAALYRQQRKEAAAAAAAAELAQKNKYVKGAVKGTGVYWTEISSRSPFHTLSYGDDFKIWVNDQVQRKKNMLSSASSHRSISKGGKKSRRNTHRRKYSKKQKPSRKQTRRHRHRRSRHRHRR